MENKIIQLQIAVLALFVAVICLLLDRIPDGRHCALGVCLEIHDKVER